MNTQLDRIDTINHYAKQKPEELIAGAERQFHAELDAAVKKLHGDKNRRIIMLAGPSASGKTTSAGLLGAKLAAIGGRAVTVSLDDFYKNRNDAPLFSDGKPDFETVHALDLEEIRRRFLELIETGESELPLFDFQNGGVRKKERNCVKLAEHDVIIVEGLHALNPLITEHLPEDSLFKIYISVSTRLHDAKGATVFSKTDLRFLRRLVRDYQFRASSVENTFQLWEGVLRGENAYLFPFRHTADIRINSMHPYETCVIRSLAIPHLEGAREHARYGKQAVSLLRRLAAMQEIDRMLVPEKSLLREFIGS